MDGDTQLALIAAFTGPGVPDSAMAPIDKQATADYLGELARRYLEQAPRRMKRDRRDAEFTLDLLLRVLSHGFWGGMTYAAQAQQADQ